MAPTWHNDLIVTLDDLLSAEECESLIAHAERLGFDEAPITTPRGPVMNKEVRDNRRVMEDDPARAALLWSRLPPDLLPGAAGRVPIGLNERWRFYRYDVGHYFAPHADGAFLRGGERSFWTLMVYLNDGCEGGETRFLDRRMQPFCTITPRAGQALLFWHPQVHESAPIRAGRKYVLRSDVMFARLSSPPAP